MIGSFLAAILVVWAGIGVYLVAISRSRGLWADALFVLVWPIHVIRHLQGKE